MIGLLLQRPRLRGKQGKVTKTTYEDFIQITDDLYTEEFLGDVEKFFYLLQENKLTGHSTNESPMAKKLRDDECIHLPAQLNQECFPKEWVAYYFKYLVGLVDEYTKEYSIPEPLSSYGWKIHKVRKGQGYHAFHAEVGQRNLGMHERCLAYMTYIQEPKKGGETEFLFQSKRVEPKRGRTLIWPAHFTHVHRGNPVLEGEKLYITGWFHTN